MRGVDSWSCPRLFHSPLLCLLSGVGAAFPAQGADTIRESSPIPLPLLPGRRSMSQSVPSSQFDWAGLAAAAATAAERLERSGNVRVVFAESCTAGLACAALGACPGISRFLCGSLVTYREGSKSAWLQVPDSLLARYSAESQEVTLAMAEGALQTTPEATVAVAITGHLGPHAPPEKDGRIHVALLFRAISGGPSGQSLQSMVLTETSRGERQIEAASRMLEILADALDP